MRHLPASYGTKLKLRDVGSKLQKESNLKGRPAGKAIPVCYGNTASLCRQEWHWMFTATGRLPMWVG